MIIDSSCTVFAGNPCGNSPELIKKTPRTTTTENKEAFGDAIRPGYCDGFEG